MTQDAPDVDLDEHGDLILQTAQGSKRVRASRSFPWSAPDQFVILHDSNGEEQVTITDLTKLPARSRGAVEAWLQHHTLVPKVLRVIEVRRVNGAWRFRLETDRGERRVLLREHEDLRSLTDGRTLLRDPDGQTFEIPPVEELDKASQAELVRIV